MTGTYIRQKQWFNFRYSLPESYHMYLARFILKKMWMTGFLPRYWKLVWIEKDTSFTLRWVWIWKHNHFGVYTDHLIKWKFGDYVEASLKKYTFEKKPEFSHYALNLTLRFFLLSLINDPKNMKQRQDICQYALRLTLTKFL